MTMTDYIRRFRKVAAQLLQTQGLRAAALVAAVIPVLYDLVPWS